MSRDIAACNYNQTNLITYPESLLLRDLFFVALILLQLDLDVCLMNS